MLKVFQMKKIKWNILPDIKTCYKAVIIKTSVTGAGINKPRKRIQKRSRNVSKYMEN